MAEKTYPDRDSWRVRRRFQKDLKVECEFLDNTNAQRDFSIPREGNVFDVKRQRQEVKGLYRKLRAHTIENRQQNTAGLQRVRMQLALLSDVDDNAIKKFLQKVRGVGSPNNN